MNYSQVLSLLCFLVMGIAGHTQDNRHQPRFSREIDSSIIEKELETVTGLLDLTESQIIKVEAIEKKFYGEYVNLVDTTVSRITRKQRMQQLQTEKEEALEKILTVTQWAKYSALIKERQMMEKNEIEERRRKLQVASSGNSG